MSEHPVGVETRDVTSGFVGVVHHGDGTCTKSWGPTEAVARRRAERRVEA